MTICVFGGTDPGSEIAGGVVVTTMSSVMIGVVLHVLTMVDVVFPQTTPNVVTRNLGYHIAARVCL